MGRGNDRAELQGQRGYPPTVLRSSECSPFQARQEALKASTAADLALRLRQFFHQPLAYAGQRLTYRLSFEFPNSPISTSLFTEAPRTTVFLSRQARTSLAGKPFLWPPARFVESDLEQVDNEGLEWEGSMEIREGEKTLDGLAVGMDVSFPLPSSNFRR